MSTPTTETEKEYPERRAAVVHISNGRHESSNDNHVAIIGMSCRFPGARNLQEYWRLLESGIDAIRDVPERRWSAKAYFSPGAAKPGKTYSRWGGFIDEIELFDSAFFGMSPREAAATDPQQRLMLEVAWEALENAGVVRDRIAGRSVGVFVGASSTDYLHAQGGSNNLRGINAYTNAGNALSVISNRISYFLDLRGPSLTVDTACSSSLVALHYARESIIRGESEMAIVGGVNLLLWAPAYVGFSQAHMLSPDGRCRSFDANGNGYVRSEGAGAVILKPLRVAITDGDEIQAVLLGSGVNQDGRTTGLSLPSEEAQAWLLEDVYSKANVDTKHVSYVEAHGTGTPVGDPIEARAIGRVLGRGRSNQQLLSIGSVKSNIGHLEPASGMASVIKTVLAMKHRRLPATLHFQSPNPSIDFDDLRLRVVSTPQPWDTHFGVPRIAGINSFGFGGTNAHLVIAEPLSSHTKQPTNNRSRTHLPSGVDAAGPSDQVSADVKVIALSAHTMPALKSLVETWKSWSEDESPSSFADLAYTAACRRTHHEHRLSVCATSLSQLSVLLAAWSDGEKRREISYGHAKKGYEPKIAFVFDGMGSQWQGMGVDLLYQNAAFELVVKQIDDLFEQLSGWSIIQQLLDLDEPTRMNDANIAQPCIFAVQMGLVAMWKHWGIEPAVVTGHSVGEVAAACTSGSLSLLDAVTVIYHRSRLQHRLSGEGRMLAVGLPSAMAMEYVDKSQGAISIAAVNSPTAVTLSGSAAALEEIEAELEANDTFCRFLPVDVPYHSDRMDVVREELLASLRDLTPRASTTRLCSTVTGKIDHDLCLDADYWWHNARDTVEFANAMDELIGDGVDLFLEVGSHAVLANSMLECKTGHDSIQILPTTKRGENQVVGVMRTLGQLHTLGCDVKWQHVYSRGRTLSNLPTYAWQRERFWFEDEGDASSRSTASRLAPGLVGSTIYSLLGERINSAQQEQAWHLSLSLDSDHQWLADHRVQKSIVFPAAAFVDQALSVGRISYPTEILLLESLEVSRALSCPSDSPISIETIFDPYSRSFRIESQSANGLWTRHCSGIVRGYSESQKPDVLDLSEFQSGFTTYENKFLYEWFASLGLEYGPTFQALTRVHIGHDIALGEVYLPDSVAAQLNGFTLCPALLDAALQTILAAAVEDKSGSESARRQMYLPSKVGRIRLHVFELPKDASSQRFYVRSHILERSSAGFRADTTIFSEEGMPLVTLENAESRAFPLVTQKTLTVEECSYQERWTIQSRIGDGTTRALPSSDCIADCVRKSLSSRADGNKHDTETTERAAYFQSRGDLYVAKAFRSQKVDWKPGTTVLTELFSEKLNLSSTGETLFGHAMERLATSRYIELHDDHFTILRPLPSVDEDVRQTDKPVTHSNSLASELIARRYGGSLTTLWSLNQNLNDFVNVDGADDLKRQITDDSIALRIGNRIIAECLAAIVERTPKNQSISVLEVAGSAWGHSDEVLSVLPKDRAEYRYATRDARELKGVTRRHHQSEIFRAIEWSPKDPLPPTLNEASFDIVISSDLQDLDRAKQLLVPNGILLFRGGIQSCTVDEQVSQWIRFSLCLPPRLPDLRSQFASAGFVDITDISVHSGLGDHPGPGEIGSSLWIAQLPPLLGSQAQVESAELPVWWIFADEEDSPREVASKLSQRRVRPISITLAKSFRRLDSARYELSLEEPNNLEQLYSAVQLDGLEPSAILYVGPTNDVDAADTIDVDVSAKAIHTSNSFRQLMQSIARATLPKLPRVYVVTQMAQAVEIPCGASLNLTSSPLLGLVRVVANELPQLRCAILDVSSFSSDTEVDQLIQEISSNCPDSEVAFRGNRRYLPRLRRIEFVDDRSQEKRDYRLKTATRGSLDLVEFHEASPAIPGVGEVELQVERAALNFKDIAKAMNLLSDETLKGTWSTTQLGLECAGTITALGTRVTDFQLGDEVFGLVPGCFGSRAVACTNLIAARPTNLTVEDAAGIPIVFMTAWYALSELARVRPGERVLIHAAAGGVGQAAIQIANLLGAEVIATAGNEFKREFLEQMGVRHVFDSRSMSFVDDVLRITHGRGVDVVLNSLAGTAIPASISLLSSGGRFVELGKRDLQDNVALGLRPFQNNLAFFALDLDRLLEQRPEMAKGLLAAVMEQFSLGHLRPVTRRTFPVSRAPEAFRYVAKAKHIGKVLLDMTDGVDGSQLVYQGNEPIHFSDDGTFVITGGMTGFGMATAKWLVSKGVKHVVILSRRGRATAGAQREITELEKMGAQIAVLSADVSDEDQLEQALTTIRSTMPPIRGVFHAAMVLNDALIIQATAEQFENVLAPKIKGAWNLHKNTVDDPIEYFVLYSSATTVFGNPGQSAYVAGCTFLNQLAELRHSQGLPAMSVDWGPILDVGAVAQNEVLLKHLEGHMGFQALPSDQVLGFLEKWMVTEYPRVSLFAADWSQLTSTALATASNPRFASVVVDGKTHRQKTSTELGQFREQFESAQPSDRRALLRNFLVKCTAGVLGAAPDQIETDRSILELGLDSLMAVELQLALSGELAFDLSPMLLLRGPTLEELTDDLLMTFENGVRTNEPDGISTAGQRGSR